MAQIITKEQFEKEHGKYRAIQIEGAAVLRQSRLTPDAEQFYLNSNELSFIFERKLVEDLFKDTPTAEFLRVYYGAIPPEGDTHGKKPGTPTIILSAAIKVNPYKDVSSYYLEWPTGLDSGGNEI